MHKQQEISTSDSQLNFSNGIYFIGIGGIGMSAIARYFHTQGVSVSGYDKTETQLTKELVRSGITVSYVDDVSLIPREISLVVFTPAIPKDHQGLNFYQQNGYQVIKRSDVLKIITENSFNICVAGTHGKTTVSTMTAHILRHSGFGCNAFLGGISVNYGTNFWSHEKNVCVVEADEYDRSFLKLSPDVAVITSMDADHLDIYHTEEALQDAFIQFSEKVKNNGILISKFGLKRGSELKSGNHISYSLQNESAGVYAANIRMDNGSYEFDVVLTDKVLESFRLNMGGMHNVENIVAAVAVANHLEIDEEKIKAAVVEFKGVKRRFEYIIKNDRLVFIDDYAHHPEELKALIKSAKALFGNWRCTLIFQPHLFSRTRDFADAFAESLDLADQVILLPIYPARELPIEGVNSEMIAGKMTNKTHKVMSKESMLEWIRKDYIPATSYEFGEIVITAGAGDIDALVEPIKKELQAI
ncbi:MAG: UDP-N-acetylmuramate--L-alanine ligase [Chitinophagaceae bacterium]|nr:UDP-N-acetylmuramate--L-alanine ligase [Chitinophagaceae bacterium]